MPVNNIPSKGHQEALTSLSLLQEGGGGGAVFAIKNTQACAKHESNGEI